MKCPRCGFVSFPGLSQCRKCGSSFDSSSQRVAPISSHSDDLEDEGVANTSQFISSSVRPLKEAPGTDGVESPHPQPTSAGRDVVPEGARAAGAVSQLKQPVNPEAGLATEMPQRVGGFRRRREAADRVPDEELRLPFNNVDVVSRTDSPVSVPSWRERPKSEESSADLDIVLGERRSGGRSPGLEFLPSSNPRSAVSAQSEPELNVTRWLKTPGEPDRLLQSDFSGSSPVPASEFVEIVSAPLGKRFLAGVLDGFTLLAAAGVFTIVFWLAGGRVGVSPLDLAILLLLIAFWLFTYFAAFGALTLATPGQSAMGLVIRNFDGECPTRQECLLRAFGYLVSIASVMLGFLWAAMDSDGLAWHDHISGTFLAKRIDR